MSPAYRKVNLLVFVLVCLNVAVYLTKGHLL